MTSKDYKNLYELGKAVLAEESARNARLDEKATRVLSGLTVLIAIYGFYGQWILQHIPPNGVLESLMLVVAALALFFVVVAWFYAFSVFKLSQQAKIPFGQGVFNLHATLDNEQFLFSLSKTIGRSIEENRKIGDKKALALSNAFRMIFCTGFLLFLLLLIIVAHGWMDTTKKGPKRFDASVVKRSNAVTEDNERPQGEPAKPPEIQTVIFPDPANQVEIPVLPPDYVTEGLDPKKLGIREKKS